ncbi:ABC transporter permease [Streptomyces sp. NPDC050704]|uniref:ABC transporter permease n=1 Tax=Streptomyces sp. NPDC050704 TaxID=3157219 RepID=UPI0034440966
MTLRPFLRPVLLTVAATAVVFTATALLPGDAGDIQRAGRASEQELADERERLGLDRPAAVRYLDWLYGAVRGDLGRSLVSGRAVTGLFTERLPATATLVAFALAVTALLTSAALTVAFLRGGRGGALATGLAAVPQSVHAAVLGMVFAGILGWLPAVSLLPPGGSPFDAPEALVLPGLTLALPSAAYATVLLRGTLDDTLRRPHVSDARVRGLPPALVLIRHVLPFLLVPAMRVTALVAGGLMAGTALVETMFGYPGTGSLLVSAVAVRDIPVVQAAALPPVVVLLLCMLVADRLAVRHSGRGGPAEYGRGTATPALVGGRA